MVSFRRPSVATLQAFVASQARLDLSYAAVGATAGTPPPGYSVDHTRAKLGEGGLVFAAAKAALGHWQQFQLGWAEIWPPDAPVQVGQVVAVVARLFGIWTWSACRVVYLVDEPGRMQRFGFAYGTLPDHPESGEERFTVEWHEDGAVWYDILAFSRPRQPLLRLAYPVLRRLQKRFARDSVAAMKRAVGLPSAPAIQGYLDSGS
jgi:uncharacterized protein (UPF0548 family)